jgi:serine/threonine protein kinase
VGTSTLPVSTHEDDGRPVWCPVARGTPLLPEHLAWARVAVGDQRETWLCWSVELWSPAIVKVVRPDWSEPRSTRALNREAWALRDLRHPAFPRLLADGTGSPLPHLVLEYLDGPALDEVVETEGPIDAQDAARLGVLLLGAVRSLHAAGRAHLDISPDNVLLVDHRPRLIDLGAARPLGQRLPAGTMFGTDGFTGPELAGWPGGTVTAALDVYGIGATLQALLDPATDVDGAVTEILERLTAAEPRQRPTPEGAMAGLVEHAGAGDARPWPGWADGALVPSPPTDDRSPGPGFRRPAASKEWSPA